MRTAIALATFVLSLRAALAADERFPYLAEVADEAAFVRCGPGESFYPTSRLLQGDQVEVHRHGPNGWCAIRPPEGEFGLLAAAGVRLLPGDDLAEVVGDEATVWIGSRLAKPDPHRWQIHLQPGERAVVLGVRTGGDGQGENAPAWYKIAPPAGEFRWIPREALVRPEEVIPPTEPPAVVVDEPLLDEPLAEDKVALAGAVEEDPPAREVSSQLPDATAIAVTVEFDSAAEPPPAPPGEQDAAPTDEVAVEPNRLPATALADASPIAAANASELETAPAPAVEVLPMPGSSATTIARATLDLPIEREAVEVVSAHLETRVEPEAIAAPPVKAPPPPAFVEASRKIEPAARRQPAESPTTNLASATLPASLSPDQWEIEAEAIQLDVTLTVAEDLSRWRLGPLHDRAVRLQQGAATPQMRERAAGLLASLDRFEMLASRYRQYARDRAAPAEQLTPRTAANSPPRPAPRGEFPVAAAGLLAPLADDLDLPPYALLDEEGQVTAYVSPARGVDLSRFAGKTVGVYGPTDFDAAHQMPHVVATRVTPSPPAARYGNNEDF